MGRAEDGDRTSPAGWYPDPSRRARLRYFDGSAWSDQVKDDLVGEITDPLGPLPPNRDAWLSPSVMSSMLAQPQPRPERTRPMRDMVANADV